MRERARTDGGLLQTGVDIACRLGQLAARRHFDVGATPCFDRHDAACRHEHDPACGYDDAERHDAASAAGQHVTTEVRALHEGPRLTVE